MSPQAGDYLRASGMQDKAEHQAGVWGRNMRKYEEELTMEEENSLISHCSVAGAMGVGNTQPWRLECISAWQQEFSFVQGQLCLSVTQLRCDGAHLPSTLCIASSQLAADLQPAFPNHSTALELCILGFLYFRLVSRAFLPPLKPCLLYK